MSAKRERAMGAYWPSKRRKTELTKLKKKVQRLTPELKHYQGGFTLAQQNNGAFTVSGLMVNIQQGDAVNNRSGDKIRVYKIELSGQLKGNNSSMDVLVVKPKVANANPAATDFTTPSCGALYNPTKGRTLLTLQEMGTDTTTYNFKRKITFGSQGLIVNYDGANMEKNECFIIHQNNTGTNITGIDFSFRIWFTDV